MLILSIIFMIICLALGISYLIYKESEEDTWTRHDCNERGCYIPRQRTGSTDSVTNTTKEGSK